ncbi:hypothetical protein [Sphingobium sp. Z007]|uniref:hypothetical protein n=1 Tax=Sphingobium sp. Z007 TaxID=627495 RepID=UPI000B4A32C8|nr:hypothetical protein [Sphingobium sp. Z007]
MPNFSRRTVSLSLQLQSADAGRMKPGNSVTVTAAGRRRLSVSCRRCWTNRPGFTGVPMALVGGVLTLFVLPTLYDRYGGRPRYSAAAQAMAA